MADRATLEGRLDALLAIRDQGVLTVEFNGRRITYRSGDELAAAIADLERRIAAYDRPAITDILIRSTKGLR
jgi:hypothetical protein